MRYFLEIAYDGTRYHGWQQQRNAITVQGKLHEGLCHILKKEIKTTASGRTDTGVHCRKQFIHFDIPEQIDTNHICYRLNNFLPFDISIGHIELVPNNAHARFDALSRTYHYTITDHKNPFSHGYAYFFHKPLNIERMNRAAEILLKYKNFKSFTKLHSNVKTFLCHIQEAYWVGQEGQFIFTITANRFLRGMVRMITGTLLLIGTGKMTHEQLVEAIEKETQQHGIALAPAHGLCLFDVKYPKTIINP